MESEGERRGIGRGSEKVAPVERVHAQEFFQGRGKGFRSYFFESRLKEKLQFRDERGEEFGREVGQVEDWGEWAFEEGVFPEVNLRTCAMEPTFF
jgi:hypothetical protein